MNSTFPATLKIENIECEIPIKTDFLYQIMIQKYLQDGGDVRFLWSVPLIEGDVVVEVGGFTGVYSKAISERYSAKIYVLEPIKRYYEALRAMFHENPRVKVLNYGLGADGHADFGLSDAGTGLFAKSDRTEKVLLKSLPRFLEDNNLTRVDVMAINIEGGEYELLDQLIESGFISRVRRLYIQFHLIAPDSILKRNLLREKLAEHHSELFCYPFVWECWSLT